MGMGKPRIGLRDVAERAGVSIGTAHKVFNDKPWVAEDTRAAVLTAAKQLGYRPRRSSVQRTAAVQTVGLVAGSTHGSMAALPFYGGVLHHIEQECGSRGISLMYASIGDPAMQQIQLPVMLQRRQVQGVMMVGDFGQDILHLIRQTELPLVLINYHVDDLLADSVTSNDERGGYIATSYLLQQGHRDPVPAIIIADSHPNFQARLAGYRRALTDHGLQPREDYVVEEESPREWGHSSRAMNVLLDLPEPPTAVFCSTDTSAFKAIDTLYARGLRVPQDCSIIGYDDVELAASATPPLTTVRVDRRLMATQAVQHLVERITQPQTTPRNTMLQTSLVVRGSVQKRTG